MQTEGNHHDKAPPSTDEQIRFLSLCYGAKTHRREMGDPHHAYPCRRCKALWRNSKGSRRTQLKTLEDEGLLTRTAFPEVPPRVEYELTPIGYAFTPVLDCIEVWGNRYIDYLHQHTTQAESLPQEEPTLSAHNER